VSATNWEARLTEPVSPTRDHIRGSVNASLTVVEYGDYECPYCRAAHLVVEAILEQSGTRLRFVFRHFPLTTIHPHAERASEAAEAAGGQGQYYAMHDLLYENQQRLEDRHLLGYAASLGLDLNRFDRDIAERAYDRKIIGDFMSGVRSGVNGTPTFYINDRRHDGSWDFKALTAAIQAAAASAQPS
jgi:protein-disulfide isomerase